MKLQSLFNRKTIVRRMAALLQIGVAALVFQGIAYAHYPIIAATVACSHGAPVISYKVTSWDPDTAAGSIASVNVLFNGAQVASAALVTSSTPADQFSGTLPAPIATGTVEVQAVPASPYAWRDGETYSTPSNIVTLTIPANCTTGVGSFTGGGTGEVDTNGDSVKSRFELPCDPHQASDLEIVWGANQFRMTNLTSVTCTLQGSPSPQGPPINTIAGTGTGEFNDMTGYTVTFEVQNNGGAGTNDEVYFVVYQTSNPRNVVVWVPQQFISSGTIPVSFDLKGNTAD
jgi:hypothetical protein